jgi:hypothetical protein
VRTRSRFVAVWWSLVCALAWLSGCEGPARAPAAGGSATSPSPDKTQVSAASQEIGAGLNDLINDATARFRPLDYEYNEELLQIFDRVEASLSGKAPGPFPRAMSKLDEQEEKEHFRETFHRWRAKTGKDLRAEIDKLKAEVAARQPGGPAFHPEFQKHFSAVFDDLIPIEVAEIRERRNRYLHEQVKPLFDSHRQKDPAAVREFEDVLNQPPYNLTPAEPTAAKKP